MFSTLPCRYRIFVFTIILAGNSCRLLAAGTSCTSTRTARTNSRNFHFATQQSISNQLRSLQLSVSNNRHEQTFSVSTNYSILTRYKVLKNFVLVFNSKSDFSSDPIKFRFLDLGHIAQKAADCNVSLSKYISGCPAHLGTCFCITSSNIFPLSIGIKCRIFSPSNLISVKLCSSVYKAFTAETPLCLFEQVS